MPAVAFCSPGVAQSWTTRLRWMVERIEDPMSEPWKPMPGTVRISFESSAFREGAGVSPDLSRESHDRYFAFLEHIASTGVDLSRLRATTYRYGPMTGGDPAYVDLLIKGIELVGAASTIVGVAAWLKSKGALETRVSEEGIELLGRWELERRGHHVTEALSVGLMPGRGDTPWGTPRRWGGYVAAYKLADGKVATLLFELDAVLRELWLADGPAAPPAVI